MELSRRNFVGSLVAAAALPSLAADDPSVFPARGRNERLALAYQHIHLGLDKPFSVLHISDTHLMGVDGRDGEDVRAFARTD